MLMNVLFLQLIFLFTSPVFSSGSKTFRNLVKEEQKILEMKEDLEKARNEKNNKLEDDWKASVKPKSVKDLRHLFMPKYNESQARHLHEHPLVSCVSSESAWVRIRGNFKLG